jgi:hypothetical protein
LPSAKHARVRIARRGRLVAVSHPVLAEVAASAAHVPVAVVAAVDLGVRVRQVADSAAHVRRAADSTVRPGPGGPSPGPGGRDRSANFGPPAPPRRLRGKKTTQQEHKPRGPIKEKTGGRIYDVDDLEDDSSVEIDDVATKSDEGVDEQDEE